MVLAEIQTPHVLPMGVGRIPPPRNLEDGEQVTIWQVYAWLTPLARRYLMQLAKGMPEITRDVALYNAGSRGNRRTMHQNRQTWREDVPGFEELEEKLLNEPIVAAHFIAMVNLPKALAHFGEVLEGARGNKSQAAMHIINVADLQARRQAKKQTPGEAPQGEGSKALEELLNG